MQVYGSGDHDLGFDDFLHGGDISQGYTDMFDVVATILGAQ